MRTFMFSKKAPQGALFNTDPGHPEPHPCPKHGQTVDGVIWYDSPSYLTMSTDDVVEAVVKQELAKQSAERPEMDAEHRKKYGYEPAQMTPDSKVEEILDEPQSKPKRKTMRLKKK